MFFICEGIIFYLVWKHEFNNSKSALIKSSREEKCLINFFMNVSTKGSKHYLECASIYKGTSPKKKTDLIEMIVYGCMNGALNKKDLEDISTKQAEQILNKNSMTINSLPGHGNIGLKEKEIKPCVKEKNLSRFDNYSFKLILILLKLKEWNHLNNFSLQCY